MDLKTSENPKTFLIQETVHIAEIHLIYKENSPFKSFLQRLEVRSDLVLVLVSSLDLTGQRLRDFISLEPGQGGLTVLLQRLVSEESSPSFKLISQVFSQSPQPTL